MADIPGQPKHRFESHLDTAFEEFVRGRVHRNCSRLNVAVYKVRQAELHLEECARAAIVECFHEAFPDSWTAPTVRKDWPLADCIIKDDRAFIRIAYSPETNALQGGHQIEAVEVFVKRAPQNVMQRTLKAIFGKPVRDPDLVMAPTGTPDGKPAAAQKSTLPKREAASLHAPNPPKQPAPTQQPAQINRPEPIKAKRRT